MGMELGTAVYRRDAAWGEEREEEEVQTTARKAEVVEKKGKGRREGERKQREEEENVETPNHLYMSGAGTHRPPRPLRRPRY